METTGGHTIATDPNNMPLGVPVTWVLGCILLPNGIPQLHTYYNHAFTGLTDVGVDDGTGAIEITHASGLAMSVQLTPGRTLARLGLVPGPSGGSGRTLVYLHDTTRPERILVGRDSAGAGIYTDGFYTLDLRKASDRARMNGLSPSLWFAVALANATL